MKAQMLDKPSSMHDQWIEIVKYVLLYVAPFVAAVWKITDKWAEVRKQHLSDSLKEAVKSVVDPKFEQIETKMDEIKKQADRDRDQVNQKLYELFKEIKK